MSKPLRIIGTIAGIAAIAASAGALAFPAAAIGGVKLGAPVPAAGPLGEAGRLVQYGGSIVELEVTRDGVESRVLRAIHETAEAA